MKLEDDTWKDDILCMAEIPFNIPQDKKLWMFKYPHVFAYDTNREVYVNLLHRDNKYIVDRLRTQNSR